MLLSIKLQGRISSSLVFSLWERKHPNLNELHKKHCVFKWTFIRFFFYWDIIFFFFKKITGLGGSFFCLWEHVKVFKCRNSKVKEDGNYSFECKEEESVCVSMSSVDIGIFFVSLCLLDLQLCELHKVHIPQTVRL